MPAATTHTVHALSVEPVPTQSAFTGPTATRPALTLAQHALTMPRPVVNEHALTTFPPQAVKCILNVGDGVCILAGDGIDSPIVHAKSIGAIRLFGNANRRGPG